jgi:cytochrome P450
MALHPDVQRKAQAEIDVVCNYAPPSSTGRVSDMNAPDANEESHIPHPANLERLSYLLAIMKEVLRFAPVANLGEFYANRHISVCYAIF